MPPLPLNPPQPLPEKKNISAVLFWILSMLFCHVSHNVFSSVLHISPETILLTVRSGSVLTWHRSRGWGYSKQGQSQCNPPATPCSFGKLYPGKPTLVLSWLLQSFFKKPSSLYSPITKSTSEWHCIITDNHVPCGKHPPPLQKIQINKWLCNETLRLGSSVKVWLS